MASSAKKYSFLLLLMMILSGDIYAQVHVRIVVNNFPKNATRQSLFIAGNFNGWDPAATRLWFDTLNDRWQLDTLLNAGLYEYKFTLGSWDQVQISNNGSDVPNNQVDLRADTTLFYEVAAWKDQSVKPVTAKHTASKHVSILDSAFYMPQLNRSRRIWIYLPEGYEKSTTRYPVLYMHDGQNIFDAQTSGFGEWGVDECMDSLIAKGRPAAIVVGIDNGEKRMTEYNPYNNTQFGTGEGESYVAFIANTLKPFVDRHYRTLPAKEHTGIAGSSMGGLISYYAVLKYPDTFGQAGIFSPAFWVAPGLNNLTDSVNANLTGKFFFYAGAKESTTMVSDMNRIMDNLGTRSKVVIYSIIDPEGQHNETAWRKWFDQFYRWIVSDGNNMLFKKEQ